MKKSYSIYTTVEEQKAPQAKYCADRIQEAPPRSEWMTVDECFDDVINSVEKFVENENNNSHRLFICCYSCACSEYKPY